MGGEAVSGGAGDDEAFVVNRSGAQFGSETVRVSHYGDVDNAREKHLAQSGGHGFEQRQRNAGMIGAKAAEKARETHRPDSAHGRRLKGRLDQA